MAHRFKNNSKKQSPQHESCQTTQDLEFFILCHKKSHLNAIQVAFFINPESLFSFFDAYIISFVRSSINLARTSDRFVVIS